MKPVKLKGVRVTRQAEGHTCGFCAASTVYRYYGLSPRDVNLRAYLGTDNNTLPYCLPLREKLQAWLDRLGFKLDKGTLPMDMLAVLYWDGFDVRCLTGDYAAYRQSLRRHLAQGHPALALAAGLAHWVVLAGMDDKGVQVVDSLRYLDPEGSRYRFTMPHEEFAETVNGVLLVKRRYDAEIRDMTLLDFTREYARGTVFSAGCLKKVAPPWIRRLLPG
jgi:ABC-type bacteriocin/lantibiotic exporter with double-glycine peptidase domain